MRWRTETVVPALTALAVIVGVVALFAPWWVQAGGLAVAPFDVGDVPEDRVSVAGVIGVGVVVVTGLVCLLGGLTLEARAVRASYASRPVASWLVIAGGALLLMGPLVAVLTWPQGSTSFWSEPPVGARAGWGWFVALAAGAVASVTGLVAERARADAV